MGRLLGDVEADGALESRKGITLQLLSYQCRLAMEPQLLWDWAEALYLTGWFVFSLQPSLLALC